MSTPKRWHVITAAATLLVAGAPAMVASAGPSDTGASHQRTVWAGSWAAAVTRGNATGLTNTGLNDQSVRMVVHTTVGGERFRVRLSNSYGEQAVRVGRATVAKPNTATPDDLSDIDPSTLRTLTFGGATSATMNRAPSWSATPSRCPSATSRTWC